VTIKLGISSCLFGEKVRWNGDHQLDRFLVDTLGRYVEYVPVCPEVESGFGVPREPFRLVGDPSAPRLVTSNTKQDHTERMIRWARKRVAELEKELLEKINELNIGAMGLGEGPTAFDVHFEMAARHPASLPVGVVISCWALRHAKATISSNGEVTIAKNSQNQEQGK